MGAVFLGQQPDLDRPVAIKVLRADRTEGENIGRFQREAKAMAAVEHPNLVRLLDYGVEAGQYFLVMEFVEGRTLAHRIHVAGGLDPDEARRVLLPVAEALQAMHEAGIVHRDIKPDNVMLAKDERVLLMDLGLARFKRRGLTATGTGRIVGTIEYMAPEMLRGERVAPSADWYSWGITAYETMTGDVPWERDTVLEAASEYDQPWLRPPPPKGVDPGHPMAQLAAWCMQGEAARRPVQVRQLRMVLGGEVPAPPAQWATPGAPDQTNAVSRRELDLGRTMGRGPALGASLLVALALWSGYRMGAPGQAPPRIGVEVRVFTDGRGEVGARWVHPGEGSLTLEIGSEAGDDVVAVPVGPALSRTVPVAGAFRARLVSAGEQRGAWHHFPTPRRTSVEWLSQNLVADGALLLGRGVPPTAGTRVVLPGGETAAVTLGPARRGVFSIRLPLTGGGVWPEVMLEEPEGPALPLWTRVDVGPLAGPTAAVTELLAELQRRPNFVANDSSSPHARELRARWTRLRPFALSGWRSLPREVQETFASVLEILVIQEGGKESWSNASTFPLDLEENRPGEGTALLRRLRSSGLLDEREVAKLHEHPNTIVRLLRKISTGIRGRRLMGKEDLARELLHTERPVDEAFLASCLRECFLPSPYVEDVPERWIAWAAWGHRVRPVLETAHSLGSRAWHGMIEDFGASSFGGFSVHSWLPNRDFPPISDEAVTRFEVTQAWASVQAAPAASRAELAWIFTLCLLPSAGGPVEERTLEAVLEGLEPLAGREDPTPLRELLRRRLEGPGSEKLPDELRRRALELGSRSGA